MKKILKIAQFGANSMLLPRIIFFGNERLSSGYQSSCVILKALLDADYEIVAVVAHHTESKSSRNVRELEVAEVAEKAGIPVLTPNKPLEIINKLRDLKADIGVLVAYGKIVPQEVIDIFPKGIVNIHPSLLPRYRGSTPIEQAMLDGAEETGVSIMQLVKEMDAGPVYAQEEVALSGQETKKELTDRLLGVGKKLLLENLPMIIDGRLKPKDQNNNDVTFCKQIEKADGQIDWTKSAVQIDPEETTEVGSVASSPCLGLIQ
jgi:methionyl-tRNA formyltransferase